MTQATHRPASDSYVERVAQIICRGLYPEAHAKGRRFADFPVTTRENLLAIAEAILIEAPVPGVPIAWLALDAVHRRPGFVTLDQVEVEDMRPEHVVPLVPQTAPTQGLEATNASA